VPIITERDKKRITDLIAIIKPEHSLEKRIDALSDDQRDFYFRWKQRCAIWMHQHRENAYELTLNGFGPARLRKNISIALFGSPPTIPFAATEKEAAEIYHEFSREQRQ
jgi:hypothetical protein